MSGVYQRRMNFPIAWKRKLFRAIGVMFAAGVLVSAVVLFASRPNPGDERTEQYAVYSAYIEDGLTEESHSLDDRRRTALIAVDATIVAELTVIQQWRFMIGSFMRLQSRPDPLRTPLMFSLFLNNLGSHKFERHFNISAEYELLDSVALSSPNLHERFPWNYGLLTFSSIAFNSDLTDALFYTEHFCGLCSGGEYVLMHKSQGTWVIVNRYGTWVS